MPNPNTPSGRTELERSRQFTEGRSKREWMQLEERAVKDQQEFGRRARLGDEEAIDIALDQDGVKGE